MQILIAILALSFLIIIHEFGHFSVAKLSDIKVQEFSLFMGPKLFSFQKGETTYSLRLIPIGGYVKMEGEEQESTDDRAFNKKPIWIRIAVIAAGAIMNLVIAVVIIAIVFTARGYSTNQLAGVDKNSPAYASGIRQNDKLIKVDGKAVYTPMDFSLFSYAAKDKPMKIQLLRGNDTIITTVKPLKHPETTSYLMGISVTQANGIGTNKIFSVTKNKPAAKLGLQPGDIIVMLDSKPVANQKDISDYLNIKKGNPVKVLVERDGKSLNLGSLTPTKSVIAEFYTTGIDNFSVAKSEIIGTIKQSLVYTYSTARTVFYSLFYLVTNKVSLKEMMGPVGIVDTIGTVVQQSPTFFDKLFGLMSITAFLSVNLGVFNLIPFPALDGSKIVILAIEGIRRKAIPPEKEAFISMVGLGLLVMLMIFATSNDIIRIFT